MTCLKNKETSLWKRKVPESAALAMTGTVYKLFGSRLLNARNQLDKKSPRNGYANGLWQRYGDKVRGYID